MINQKGFLLLALLFVVLALVVGLLIRYQVQQYQEAQISKAEYAIDLLSQQINSSLLYTDSLLREVISILNFSRESDAQTLGNFLGMEQLLHEEIAYLRLFDGSQTVIWASNGAFDENTSASSLFEAHYSDFLDFATVNQFSLDRGEYILQLSRVLRDDWGDVRFQIEAGLSDTTLLPDAEDPTTESIVAICLSDSEGLPISSKTYQEQGIDCHDEHVQQLFRDADRTYASSRIQVDNDLVYSMKQLLSFPYHLIMIHKVEEDFHSLQIQSLLQIGMIFFITGVIWILMRLKAKDQLNQVLSRHNNHLQQLNSELKALSDERTLLVQEVHHRVKNNLALVNSIINMIHLEGGPYNEEIFTDLSARMLAIQQVHEILYQGEDLTNIEVSSYLGRITEMIVSSLSAKNLTIENHTDTFVLPSKLVIPLGILIAELVTNAIKYGLQENGSIFLDGTKDSQGNVCIRMANDGNKYKNGKAGLGSQIIESLCIQLRGRVRLETDPITRFTIEFPTL